MAAAKKPAAKKPAAKVKGSPPARPAPYKAPAKPKVAPKGTMYSDSLSTKTGIVGMKGSKAKTGVGAPPRVSGATYTPGKGTKVTRGR